MILIFFFVIMTILFCISFRFILRWVAIKVSSIVADVAGIAFTTMTPSAPGLEVHEFDALSLKIKERYSAFEQKWLSRGDRKRAVGAGHPFKLPLTSRLLILL